MILIVYLNFEGFAEAHFNDYRSQSADETKERELRNYTELTNIEFQRTFYGEACILELHIQKAKR